MGAKEIKTLLGMLTEQVHINHQVVADDSQVKEQMTALRSQVAQRNFIEQLEEERRIMHYFDGKKLFDIMEYAALMDRDGSLSLVTYAEERNSTALSRPALASRSSFRQPRLNHLALENGEQQAPGSEDLAESQHELTLEDEEEAIEGDTAEMLFARLRQNNLCFNCAGPNCVSRNCRNPPADPKTIQLTHTATDGPVHVLPDDAVLYSLLQDYGSLNGVAPAKLQ